MKKKYMILLFGAIGLGAFYSVQTISAFAGFPFVMVISGDSMVPALQSFDLILLKPVNPEGIRVGDIVAVDHRDEHNPFAGYVVHRVQEIKEKDGELLIRTKGDNIKRTDFPVPVDDVVAKVDMSIPFVGFIMSPPLNIIILVGLLYAALRIYKKER